MSAFSALLRRELGALFATPLGWALSAAFLTVEGLLFWTLLQAFAGPDAPHGEVFRFLFGGSPWFWLGQAALVPLLTMRLVAEERRAGTLEALLTTPVSAAQVAVAKFLGAWAFYLFLWVPTLAYVAFLGAHLDLDPGPIAAGYLGVALVGAALVSVGLLASALAPGPVVAAAAAFAVIAALLSAGLLTPHLPAAAPWLDHFSLPAAMADFARGIVDTRRVVYPLALTTLCLFLTARALEARRLR
jgi:ABC-2 type transport system permease protein